SFPHAVTPPLRCALQKVSNGDSTDNQTPSNTREGSGHGPYTEGKAPALGCPRSPRRGRSHIHSQGHSRSQGHSHSHRHTSPGRALGRRRRRSKRVRVGPLPKRVSFP